MLPTVPRRMLISALAALMPVGFVLVATAPLSACAQGGCDREVEVAPGAASPGLAQIDAAVHRAMADWNVPGLALAVVKDGVPILVKGYGVRDVTHKEPVTPETIFGLLSPTKSFTATALAMLVDEGRLSWDDPVERYLPEFKLSPSDAAEPLKVRHLVGHASGYVDDHSLWYRSDLRRNQLVARATELERPFGAGKKFNYNNTMFIVAGALIERVSGRTWEEFIQTRFFDPLGMDRSTTGDDALAGLANTASPHVPRVLRRFGEPKPVPYEDVNVIGPAGAIHTSAKDMVPWLQFNLDLGRYRGQQLVSAAALKKL